MKSFLFFSVVLLFSISNTVGQSQHPTDYFGSPLDIPLYLAGNFGELRPNHFHSGIDIKTQGVEGKKIYAVADGTVSRIKISENGYGKALYISHPNGYTSVYAHLKSFNPEIESYIKQNQYRKESFEIELFPTPLQLRFKKGDFIALSGNSGGSKAPHLHFEIRDTKTEYALNPLLFGFDIKDNRPPVLRGISIYPLNEESYVNGSNKRLDLNLEKTGDAYYLKNGIRPKVKGEIGIGVEAYDLLDEVENKCGVYSIALMRNGEPIYKHELERFSFYETRYMNAHMDFSRYVRQGRKTQRSFMLPNNRLSIYHILRNKGRIGIYGEGEQKLQYELKDVAGNTSVVKFELVYDSSPYLKPDPKVSQKAVARFKWDQKNTYQNEDVILYLPQGVLYDDLDFNYSLGDKLPGALSPTYKIHDETVPLHSYIILSIKNKTIPADLRSKTLVMSYTKSDGFYPEGGTWKGDYIVLKTRSFGDYTIMLDTIPPSISPINISQGENMSKKWSIMVRINDNLSGIKSYRAEVDNEWILMEFDKKNGRLTHFFDEKIPAGQHHFKLLVKDEVGNSSTFECDFTR